MSLFPCTACHERKPGKLANVTIAWWTQANARVAWRLRLCIGCYSERILPIQVDESAQELTCPMCHSAVDDDMDPCYLTAFLPNIGRTSLEMPTCNACAAVFRVFAQDAGSRLQDQLSGGQGPGPQTDSRGADSWASLGIYPRE